MNDDFEVVTNRERCAKQQRITELRKVGTILSNLLYNFSQQKGRTLTVGDCKMMKWHQQNWDEVVKKDRP